MVKYPIIKIVNLIEATQTNEHIEDGNIEFREFSEDDRKDSVDSLDMPETVDDKFIEDL